MASERYDLMGGTEWAHDPAFVECDLGEIKGRVLEVQALVRKAGLSYAVEWGQGPAWEFFQDGDDGGVEGYADTDDVRWEGPNLKVFQDDAQLYWAAKHTDETVFFKFDFNEEPVQRQP